MRQALVNANADLCRRESQVRHAHHRRQRRGQGQLDNFIDPEERYPVIATTSKLMTTGVDAQTCKLIVLDQRIDSMTEFKQIIGRGTRINEDYDKLFFTIMDFRRRPSCSPTRTSMATPCRSTKPRRRGDPSCRPTRIGPTTSREEADPVRASRTSGEDERGSLPRRGGGRAARRPATQIRTSTT